jgi:hypothetical protein
MTLVGCATAPTIPDTALLRTTPAPLSEPSQEPETLYNKVVSKTKSASTALLSTLSTPTVPSSDLEAVPAILPVSNTRSSSQLIIDSELLSTKNSQACDYSAVDKYSQLGQFYRRKYVSDLVFDATVEVEKVKASQQLAAKLTSANAISPSGRVPTVSQSYDAHNDAQVLDLQFSPGTFDIQNPTLFYHSVTQDPYLSYFNLRKKVGSWWVYSDLSSLLPWERYFWIAYFTEKGFEPEFSTELGFLVLGNFSTSEEAIAVSDSISDLSLNVAFTLYRPYNTQPTSEIHELSDFSDAAPVSDSVPTLSESLISITSSTTDDRDDADNDDELFETGDFLLQKLQ